jgi:hypothetical protein
MRRLTEVEYEDIFSPETMASLKGKSGDSLRQMLGNKNLRSAMSRTGDLLNELMQAEEGYRDELEMVAAQMVTDAFPIIDYANIKIDGKIVTSQGDFKMQAPPPQDDPASPDFGEDDPEKMKAKRRIINGITQGASVRGSFWFLMFKEYLNAINPELVDKYNEILKLAFGIYDDENAIAMMLAMLAQGQKIQGGESEMEYDEENEQFVIKAAALCFPMLVHEIIKGLYEIVGTEGFGADKEKNQAIIGAVDKLSNEPRDFQYGKFIFDALNDLYKNSGIEDARVRELFFAEVYKLIDDEFFSFIENAVNNKLMPLQKKWAKDTMADIARDLGKDDTGLEDLDESKPIQEIDMKQVIAAAAILLGTAGAPNTAQAQNPVGKLLKKGVTAVQNKLNPKPKIDTVKIQKDAPLALAKFKDYNGVGYGYAESRDQRGAMDMARLNAKADLMKKLGKEKITAGFEEKDSKLYQNADGTYAAEVLIVIGNI